MTDEELTEAVAKALHWLGEEQGWDWETLARLLPKTADSYREDAKHALAVARPVIRRQALEEAASILTYGDLQEAPIPDISVEDFNKLNPEQQWRLSAAATVRALAAAGAKEEAT